MATRAHPRLADRAKQPRYRFADAARLIARRPQTVRRWALGNERVYQGERRSDPPLIKIDGSANGDSFPLSFLNLLELRFLASWRERISLPVIRKALDYSAQQLHADRPLLDLDFKLHGRDLFVQYGEQLLTATKGGQLAWPSAVTALFESLDYDEGEHTAYRWWPLGRERPVLLDTRVNGGRPTTSETGVRTIAVASRLREGWSASEIKADTAASVAEIKAAAQVEGMSIAA